MDKKYISINKCSAHGFYMIAIEDDNGGHRITPTKCCGSWQTVIKWIIDKSMIDDFNNEVKTVGS